MEAIVTRGLTRRFGTKTAVDGLDLTVKEGELLALLGVNGAGKTTTVKMLSTLLAPTSGDAVLLGSSIVTDAQRVKPFLAVSPQETAVAMNLTVRENLALMAGIYGADKKAAEAAADAAIREFSLSEYENTRAGRLSGGWQRRLSIAMALISKPKILFLDEPTLGLDVLARRELWDVIRRLKGQVTMILTTHYLEEAESLSDRVAVMAGGRLRALGTPEALKALAGTESFEDAFIRLAKEAAV